MQIGLGGVAQRPDLDLVPLPRASMSQFLLFHDAVEGGILFDIILWLLLNKMVDFTRELRWAVVHLHNFVVGF